MNAICLPDQDFPRLLYWASVTMAKFTWSYCFICIYGERSGIRGWDSETTNTTVIGLCYLLTTMQTLKFYSLTGSWQFAQGGEYHAHGRRISGTIPYEFQTSTF